MKKLRFTESQIVAILKEGAGGVAQITRKHGITAATDYHWTGLGRMERDAEVIRALQAIVVEEQRLGF